MVTLKEAESKLVISRFEKEGEIGNSSMDRRFQFAGSISSNNLLYDTMPINNTVLCTLKFWGEHRSYVACSYQNLSPPPKKPSPQTKTKAKMKTKGYEVMDMFSTLAVLMDSPCV